MNRICSTFVKNTYYDLNVQMFHDTLLKLNPVFDIVCQFTSDCPNNHLVEIVHYLGYHANIKSSMVDCYTSNNSLLYVMRSVPMIEFFNGIVKMCVYEILVSVGKYTGYFESLTNPHMNIMTDYKNIPANGIGVIGINYQDQNVYDILSNTYKNDCQAFELDVFSKPSKYPVILQNHTGINGTEHQFYKGFFHTDPSSFGFGFAKNLDMFMHKSINYDKMEKDSIIYVEKKIINHNPSIKDLSECFYASTINHVCSSN